MVIYHCKDNLTDNCKWLVENYEHHIVDKSDDLQINRTCSRCVSKMIIRDFQTTT